MEMRIHIGTYSSHDLPACGVYRYTEAPDFAVILFSYSIDGGPVRCVDLARGERIPGGVLAALTDPGVTKTAFNAAFERVCIGRYLFGRPLDPAQWRCTMVQAARMGLPLSLEQCAGALRLGRGEMREDRALMRHFSAPGKDGRRMPADAPGLWEEFKRYNIRDAETERQISAKAGRLEPAGFDVRLYATDQRINDRGVLIDRRLAENAARIDDILRARLLEEARRLTGLDNPNSPSQIRDYLHRATGLSAASLDRRSLDDLEDRLASWPEARRVLRIRRETGRTSTRKYRAMLECVCDDGRIRGMLQFHGAARTGRWAGRLVQVQNLPQNRLPDPDYARGLVRAGDPEELLLNYASPAGVLSELIRTAFIAKPGSVFHICDFSAIEARVIAWLCGEKWVLDVFRAGGDIYCATAEQMFRRRVERHGENAELRKKGKIAALALGYGGGVSALEAMGGSRMGLTEREERDITARWRAANPHIVRFWTLIERAALRAMRSGEEVTVNRGITVSCRWGMLLVRLPSGRTVCYPRATAGTETGDGRRDGRGIIEYEGMDQTTGRWGRIRTYGGKLTENIVQAIARDILGHVLLRAEEAGLDTVLHVHDEIVVEARPGQELREVEELFREPPGWCRDLPLQGSGYTSRYYLKA